MPAETESSISSKKVVCRIIWLDDCNRNVVVWHQGSKIKTQKNRESSFKLGDFVYLTTTAHGGTYISPLSRRAQENLTNKMGELMNAPLPGIRYDEFRQLGLLDSRGSVARFGDNTLGDSSATEISSTQSPYSKKLYTQVVKIYEDKTKEDIKQLFDDSLLKESAREVIKRVFSSVASQRDSKFSKLKIGVFNKADLLIEEQYIMKEAIGKVLNFMLYHFGHSKKSGDEVGNFSRLQFFLQRLREITSRGEMERSQVATLFREIYDRYTETYGKEGITAWINSNSRPEN